jgi:hypothetical protein
MRLLLAAALLCSASAQARGTDVCDFESEFDLRIQPQSLVFHRDSGSPETIEMRGGRLLVDGREVALSADDSRRIAHYESEVRALVPEVRAIAMDAVGIAGEAMTQVATMFAGSNSEKAIRRMDELTDELEYRISASNDTAEWDNDEFEDAIETLVGELVPMMMGDIASVAIAAVLTGDEEAVERLEQRAERMEKAIEERVERRADELEARAEALCPRVKALDELEDALTVRLADNRPLQLLEKD